MNQIIQGDALTVLRSLPSDAVQTCVTSPPYYCQRDYEVEGQIGLEETPAEFIQKLVEIFCEVRRVLHPSGTLWINIGDTYANDRKWGGSTSGKHVTPLHGSTPRARRYTGLAAGNLVGIPWRLAFALQDEDWILRSDSIWHKTNCLPEPVEDRPTKAHEYVFLLAKNRDYYYNADAIREPIKPKTLTTYGSKITPLYNDQMGSVKGANWASSMDEHKPRLNDDGTTAGANKRSVWSISSNDGYSDAKHFATMPTRLAEICILAGSAPGDLVLDPFSGSGTSLLVAAQNNRRYIGIELSEEYIKLAEKRLAVLQPKLWGLEAV